MIIWAKTSFATQKHESIIITGCNIWQVQFKQNLNRTKYLNKNENLKFTYILRFWTWFQFHSISRSLSRNDLLEATEEEFLAAVREVTRVHGRNPVLNAILTGSSQLSVRTTQIPILVWHRWGQLFRLWQWAQFCWKRASGEWWGDLLSRTDRPSSYQLYPF